MVASGSVLGGKYELLSLIGEGGMGAVWHAKRLDLNAEVAVKVLHAHAARREGALERFKQEARAAASLRSPHLVQILDYGVDPESDTPFIAMELLEGESLGQRLERLGHLSPEETGRWLSHVARALSKAHAATIVHRDLKPENIFLVQNEDDELAKVVDFGVAKTELKGSRMPLTETGAVVGTPHYMAPEQVEDSGRIDFRADLWSLGIIACECLTGSRPFEAESFSGLAMKIALGRAAIPSTLGTVPRGFDEWFARATQLNPADRFGTASEMAEAFLQLLVIEPQPRAPATERLTATALADTGLSHSRDAPSVHRLHKSSPSLTTRSQFRPGKWLSAAALVVAFFAAIAAVLFGAPSESKLSEPAPSVVIAASTAKPMPPAVEPPPKTAQANEPPESTPSLSVDKKLRRKLRRKRSPTRQRTRRKPRRSGKAKSNSKTTSKSKARALSNAPKVSDALDAYDIQ